MAVTDADLPAYPRFRHQLDAMLAQMAREQRELFGPVLRRIRRRDREAEAAGRISTPAPWAGPGRVWSISGGRRIDFSLASPITWERRQSDNARLPHFDFTHITRTIVPRSKSGETHPRYPAITGVAADHHGYVTDGALSSLASHYDYVTRHSGGHRPGDVTSMMMDVLDFADDHHNDNRLTVLSNIGSTPQRQRSLFEAAERYERQARRGTLTVSTEHFHSWALAAGAVLAPDWMKEAVELLKAAHAEVTAKAARTGKPAVHRKVTLCNVDLTEAYDRLIDCDRWLSGTPLALPKFEHRSGRIQTRFVAELPRNLPMRDQHEIMRRFCEVLDRDGWMYVGAIHRPDPHSAVDNMHMHIDCYDRPSKWLAEKECWDFEYCVRKNGKSIYPKRQNKIAHARGKKDGQSGITVARDYYKGLRAAYVKIANSVVDGREGNPFYVAGTYRDNNIPLTPLKHLGNRTIAREKQGIATKTGSHNARLMIHDRLRSIHQHLNHGLAALGRASDRRLTTARTTAAQQEIRRWRELQSTALNLAAEAAVARVARDALASRAEAVVANPHTNASDTVAAAREWIDAVDAVAMPHEADQLGDAVRTIRTRASRCLGDAQANDSDAAPVLAYRARSTEPVAQPKPGYRKYLRRRLLEWLDRHEQDAEALSFDGDVVTLGPSETRRAIDRLWRLLIEDAEIQERLHRERARRQSLALSKAAEMPEPTPPPRSRPPRSATGRRGSVPASMPVTLPANIVRSKGPGDVERRGPIAAPTKPAGGAPETSDPARHAPPATEAAMVPPKARAATKSGKPEPRPALPADFVSPAKGPRLSIDDEAMPPVQKDRGR